MMEKYEILQRLDLANLTPGSATRYRMRMIENGIGQSVNLPIMTAKGLEDGPVLGITALVHGNELNGLKVVQDLFKIIDPKKLRGTLIAVPVVNVPAALQLDRRFTDGVDLNRIMPGKAHGNESDVYAHRFMDRVVKEFDYLIDLHTASFGRANSFYVRADLSDKVNRELALLQQPEIILNNAGGDGTLRSAAADLGIQAITVEVGNPNRFQRGMIRSGVEGIINVMVNLGMIDKPLTVAETPPVLCRSSFWMYTDRGGILEVKPDLTDLVEKGEEIALLRNVYGDVVARYNATQSGIVIGKSTQPLGQSGSRIIHIGVPDAKL